MRAAAQRPGPRGPQPVRDHHHGVSMAVPADQDRGPGAVLGHVHRLAQRGRDVDGPLGEQPKAAHGDVAAAGSASYPRPGSRANPVTGARPPNRAAASRAIAWPMGCSEASSTAPASSSGSSRSAPEAPGSAITAVTVMAPVVRVPVLSSTTTRTRRADSSARTLLTRMPSSAPRPTAATSAVGVARPSAHGQATTRTATAALQPCGGGQAGAEPEAEGRGGQ